jgi:hypothetical protein
MKTAKLISALLTVALLSACAAANSGTAAATPTPVNISALQTSAVQTVVANLTQTAAAQPTQAPTETLTPIPLAQPATVTPTLTASATTSLCDDAIFINDASVPDGTQMTAGQAFVKTWKVKNIGTCSWKVGYQLIYAYGEKMGGLPTALTAEVLPGSEVEISINLKAPAKTGNYGGYWRLANNNGLSFGQRLSVVIVVP